MLALVGAYLFRTGGHQFGRGCNCIHAHVAACAAAAGVCTVHGQLCANKCLHVERLHPVVFVLYGVDGDWGNV